jgi:hypothetical protein
VPATPERTKYPCTNRDCGNTFHYDRPECPNAKAGGSGGVKGKGRVESWGDSAVPETPVKKNAAATAGAKGSFSRSLSTSTASSSSPSSTYACHNPKCPTRTKAHRSPHCPNRSDPNLLIRHEKGRSKKGDATRDASHIVSWEVVRDITLDFAGKMTEEDHEKVRTFLNMDKNLRLKDQLGNRANDVNPNNDSDIDNRIVGHLLGDEDAGAVTRVMEKRAERQLAMIRENNGMLPLKLADHWERCYVEAFES